MQDKIVVTGIGCITSIGKSKEEIVESLKSGRSGVDKVSYFDVTDYPTKVDAEVKDFNPLNFGIDKKIIRRLDKFCHFALVASKLAIEDSKMNFDFYDRKRMGCIVATGIGGIATMEEQHKVLQTFGVRKISPFLVPAFIPNMAAGLVSIEFGLKGPSSCTVTACAASANALSYAYDLFQQNKVDVMVVGGTEAAITPLPFAGFCALHAMTRRNDNPQKASSPFDKKRDGFVMGEGSSILVLERESLAKKRGADIYAEFLGYGISSDAFHITDPCADGEGAISCMQDALKNCNLKLEEINYINAHGTSTFKNDEMETLAVKKVFGDYAKNGLLISSTKSTTGHCMGTAGSIEAAITVLSIKNNFIPPTMNLDDMDEKCDLNYVPNKYLEKEINIAMSNSFGFGGHNVSLVFKKYS